MTINIILLSGGLIMDYERIQRLHYVNHLSIRGIAESCNDCN